MKKLLLVLSVLSVVGLQAAAQKVDLNGKQELTSIEQVQKDKATEVEIVLNDGTNHKESVWSLQSKYSLMFALVECASDAVYTHDKEHMKALVKHRPKGSRDARSLVETAYQVKGSHPEKVFNHATYEYENSAATKNYRFLQSLQVEAPNASSSEVV